MIDVDDTVLPDEQLQWVRSQRPEDVERRRRAEHEERKHALAAFLVRLEQQHAKRQQEREQSLGIEHERRAHVVRHRRRKDPIQAEPDESLDELMNGEKYRQRREEQFAAVFHLRQGNDADSTENSAANKVRRG